MPRIYLKLFGTASVLVNDQPYAGRGTHRHRVALLALLAAHDSITRDKLLGYLWPESPMARARASLSESLYVLKKALGEDSIVVAGEELRLNRAVVDTDVWQFERAVASADAAPAADAYRGEFMDGFFVDDAPELQDFIERARGRYAAQYVRVLQKLFDTADAGGDVDAQLRWARAWVAAARTDANATLALMHALARAGDAPAALEQARVYQAQVAEFDAEPDARVAQLAPRIRNGEVAPLRVTRVYGPGDRADSLVAPLRGRRRWLVPLAGVLLLLAIIAAGIYRNALHAREKGIVTLAVLPFQLGNAPRDQQFLALGIPDAIITRLSEHDNLRVRPTSTILNYTRDVNVKRAARELDVDYLITGFVERLPGELQVRMQLVSAREGSVTWGKTYRIPAAQLSTLQDSIAADLSSTIPVERTSARERAVIDGAAYESYLRGRALLARHREAELREAASRFEQVIARAPDFAPAHAGLAIASAEMNLRFASKQEANTWAERALASARRALQLDFTQAEVHQALAAVYRKTEFDWAGTIRESQKAIALNPNLATPYFYIGGAYFHLGLLDEGRKVVRAGMRKQPQADRVEALRTLATIELASGNYGRAITLLQDVQRRSDHAVADQYLAAAYYYNGDVGRAEELLRALARSSSATAATRARALLASILAARGQHDSAQVMLREAMKGVIDHHAAYSIGTTYAWLKQPGEAVKWLQTAADTGFQAYPWYERDPLLSPLHTNDAFRAFMRALRTTWQQNQRLAVSVAE